MYIYMYIHAHGSRVHTSFFFLSSFHVFVDVLPLRHSARPFHHTRSSIARLLPSHPPITQAPVALPPAVRANSFAPSPVPSSLLLSSSPAPPLLLLHSIAHYTDSYTAQCTMLPARVRSNPREHQRRARSDEVSGSAISIVYRYDTRFLNMIGQIFDTTNLGSEVGRRSCFVPLTPELTMYLCSTASTLL
jgi:hypothetical protein